VAWCDAADVRELLKVAKAADGWEDTEIEKRITRAEDDLTSILSCLYGTTEVATWTISGTPTIPPLIRDLCAKRAVVEILKDGWGETMMAEGHHGEIWQGEVDQFIADLRNRVRILLDVDGERLPMATAVGKTAIGSNTREREATFTMNRSSQDENTGGSLDDW
jgi:hypothetical protein